MKKILYLFLLFSLFSCSNKKNNLVSAKSAKQDVRICASVKTVSDEYIPLFHTNVFIRTEDEKLADKIENQLIQYHKLFDQYHYYYADDSQGIVKNLKVVNEYISKGNEIEVSEDLSDLLTQSFKLMKLTNGNFNIFLEPLTNLYAGKFSAFPLENTDPLASDVKNALSFVLEPDSVSNYIKNNQNVLSFEPFNNSFNYVINVGAISKGYAAQKIADFFPEKEFMLSLGSSTIVASGKSYRIGVASTYYKTLALFQINLPSGLTLSTSGTGNNYYILADDKKTIRCHILDPKTGYSNNYYWSVVIISDNAMVSDAMSTALFNVKDKNEILQIIDNVKKSYNCKIEACFVKDSSPVEKTVSLLMTKGFDSFVRKEYEGIGITSIDYLE